MLRHRAGTVPAPEDQAVVNAFRAMLAALHNADRGQVPVFTTSGRWVGEAPALTRSAT